MTRSRLALIASSLALLLPTACSKGGDGVANNATSGGIVVADPANDTTPGEAASVTVQSGNMQHVFSVEMAKTSAQQQRGMKFHKKIADDEGMLFAPYPVDGGPPARATFFMKDTPVALDIIFIRADHTIAKIVENAAPNDEALISSGEPVSAILEIKGGEANTLGIAAGDKVSWPAS